jgi:DNA-binding ferritin-like protein (Dps family)
MWQLLISYNTINDRIIYIRMKARPVNITGVQVYAPTTSAETADIEDFYRNLHLTLNETPRKDVLVFMGDWNSKIGKGEEPGTVGKYGLGNRHDAGERLLEFCEENGFFLANTYFEQPERSLYTWTSPDDQYRIQIDYTLGKRQWRSAFQSVKTRLDADCGSNHELLTAKLIIKLKNTKRNKHGWKLDIDNIPEEYKTEIKEKHATINLQGGTPVGTWKDLKDALKEVAGKTIPKKGKEKWTHLDVTRYADGRGEQTTIESGRKLGGSEEIKMEKYKRKLGRTRRTIRMKIARC